MIQQMLQRYTWGEIKVNIMSTKDKNLYKENVFLQEIF